MEGLSTVLMAAGSIIAFVGGILFLIAAFRESILWGILCLCFSPVQIVFLIIHWQEAKKPFFIELLGIAISVVGVLIAPDGGARMHTWLHGCGLG